MPCLSLSTLVVGHQASSNHITISRARGRPFSGANKVRRWTTQYYLVGGCTRTVAAIVSFHGNPILLDFFVNGASILRCSCSAAVANVSVQSDHVYNTASVTTLPVYLLYPMRRQAAIDSLGQPSGLPKIRLLAYLWTSGFPHRINRQRFYTCKFCHRWSLI